jgi:hypothetical protein
MMRDIIERFRYRFELWRREHREEYFSPPCAGSEEPDYVSFYADHPKRAELLRESTVKSIGRFAAAYFGIIVIAAQVCLVLGRLVPQARFVFGLICVVFAGLWTLITIMGEVRLRKARRQYRQQQATNSSNQALQLTAARRDEPVSIHEPPYTPSIPRLRQR